MNNVIINILKIFPKHFMRHAYSTQLVLSEMPIKLLIRRGINVKYKFCNGPHLVNNESLVLTL